VNILLKQSTIGSVCSQVWRVKFMEYGVILRIKCLLIMITYSHIFKKTMIICKNIWLAISSSRLSCQMLSLLYRIQSNSWLNSMMKTFTIHFIRNTPNTSNNRIELKRIKEIKMIFIWSWTLVKKYKQS